MGYYVSNMIGIRTGGVFSGETDIEDMKKRIAKIVVEMRSNDSHYPPDLGDEKGDVSHCMSQELSAHKGSYVVIAGVFNYWTHETVEPFCKRLSKEFGTEVMFMSWDEEISEFYCQVYLDGEPIVDVNENPIGRVLRRIA